MKKIGDFKQTRSSGFFIVCNLVLYLGSQDNIKRVNNGMAESSTSYKKGDKPPKSRPARGKGKKSLMLEAVRSTCSTEQEFLIKVVQIGLGDPANGLDPNPTLLNMVLQRIEPPLKANNECVNFEFNPNLAPHEQATQVLNAASKGIIPPDIAAMFIGSIQSMLKIQEVTDFDERLKELERLQDDEN